MISSYCLSPKKLASPAEAVFVHNYHLYLPKNHHRSNFFLFKDREISVQPCLGLAKAGFPILRIKNSRLAHPFASISSFAESESEEQRNESMLHSGHHQNAEIEGKQEEERLPGMAQAFSISASTASAISICIAFAALTFPLFMKSLGQGMILKTKVLSYATLLFGFYMAWNIGANDVANAMGTSVGSGALTLRQAVLTAAVLEFSGALLMGTHVTSTMQKGILVANVFQGKDTLLFAGLLSSLAAAGTWLQVYTALML